MAKTTLQDVADRAGVALSTASNALNGSDLVTESTREKVLAAAKALDYIPNINGKLLRGGKSKRLAFVTSSVRGEYFERLLDRINYFCNENKYQLDIIISRDSKILMSRMLEGIYDGFFVFEGEFLLPEDLERLIKSQIKIVFLDREYSNKNISSVLFDSEQASYELTNYLINLGHRNIAYVDFSAENYDSRERRSGYLRALEDNNIDFKDEYILYGEFDEKISYQALLDFYKEDRDSFNEVSAYLCGNDQSAIGVSNALKELNFKLPEEKSVAGFDDISLSKYFNPSITTVHNPIEKQGEIAAKLLIGLVNEDFKGQIVKLEGKLIKRESTANV